jgi:prepilin-type N-terminal cleavage/methylation domain-containing protein
LEFGIPIANRLVRLQKAIREQYQAMIKTRLLRSSRRVFEEQTEAKVMQIKTNKTAAFTLVEIMIVVAIIGLLAAIAIPNFVKARETAQLNSIFNNLRIIDGAKDQWALENKKGTGDLPDWTSGVAGIADYLKGGTVKDVVGETYTIQTVGTNSIAKLTATVKLGTYGLGATIP